MLLDPVLSGHYLFHPKTELLWHLEELVPILIHIPAQISVETKKKKVCFFQTDSNAGERDGVSWKSVITH